MGALAPFAPLQTMVEQVLVGYRLAAVLLAKMRS
jgi:hypothetical protein